MSLSPEALALFLRYAREASQWSGTPMVECKDAAEKGFLTDLKRKGYLSVFKDNGIEWIQFSPSGVALALEHCIIISLR